MDVGKATETMTRDEALKLLRGGEEGVTEFNRRRGACADTIDLSGIELPKRRLHATNGQGVMLARCDLSSADLRGIDLSNGYLHTCRLASANLQEASLDNANASGVDFTHANLCRASLSGTMLRNAKLIEPHVAGLSLEGAVFDATTIVLSPDCPGPADIIGLERVVHRGPSSISVDTLRSFHDAPPELFLRGCGLQPWEIVATKLYDPDLSGREIAELQNEVYQLRAAGPIFLGGVFISYSHDDIGFVDKIRTFLMNKGANVWLDRHDAVAGPLRRQVVDQIRLQDVVAVVLSQSSIDSKWVAYEIGRALQKEQEEDRYVLCPLAVDDAWKAKKGDPWDEVREKLVLDFSKWEDEAAFNKLSEKLLKGLKVYYAPTEKAKARNDPRAES